jgi:hypothetical protein
VSTSWQMVPHQTFVDLSPLELSGESSQFDANEHTLLAARGQWHGFPLVDGTSYTPRRW